MLKYNVVRRGGMLAILAALSSVLIGLSSSASAAALIYQKDNASLKITGGEAIALNSCINDAQDGVINTQINACNQIATSGNIVELDNVSLYVFASGCYSGVPLFHASNVHVEVTGGVASALNLCLNDSRDGVINTQINQCSQYAVAGNIAFLSSVWVGVYQ